MDFEVTSQAGEFLKDLLSKQDTAEGVKLYIENPGTPRAEVVLAYKYQDDKDLLEQFTVHDLKFFVLPESLPYLAEAKIDFDTSLGGGNLTIKAPNSKMPQLGESATITDRINFIIWNDINPGLSAHGGEVSLVEVTSDMVAVLAFGGGCQGCAQVDLTLKHGVEQQILAGIPELTGIRDVTDHSDRSNSYY